MNCRAFVYTILLPLLLGLFIACGPKVPPRPTPTPTPSPTLTRTPAPTPTPVSGNAEAGQHLFAEVCAPCHGHDATGIAGIGLNLTNNEFVGALTIPQLTQFISRGRPIDNPFNVTGITMPAQGGRMDLNDNNLLDIAAYLHQINTQVGTNSPQAKEYLAWFDDNAETADTGEPVDPAETAGPTLEGQTTYFRYCAVCHGPQGEGVDSLGKSLIASDFVAELANDELAQFIAAGRPVNDPLNTTQIEMLPYGGQAPFTGDVMENLVAYLRTINTGETNLAPRPSDVGQSVIAEDALALSDEELEALQKDAVAIMLRAQPKCFTCHRIGERGNKSGPGPQLTNIGAVASERVPGLSARAYIEQSIIDPAAFIVPECPSGSCVDGMPNEYAEQLGQEKLETIVSFLLTLKE